MTESTNKCGVIEKSQISRIGGLGDESYRREKNNETSHSDHQSIKYFNYKHGNRTDARELHENIATRSYLVDDSQHKGSLKFDRDKTVDMKHLQVFWAKT